MKFLCLGYYDEKKFDALPKEKLAEIVTRCKVHDEELYRGGKLMLVASLAKNWARQVLSYEL